jgi:hypothetical protein
LIRRTIEAAKILPVVRFASSMQRESVEHVIDEHANTGHAQPRRRVLNDLQSMLEPPQEWEEIDVAALVSRVADATDPWDLRTLANEAIWDPQPVGRALATNQRARDRIAELMAPSNAQQLRGPALTLAGLLGEAAIVQLWTTERARQLRLAVLDGIGLLAVVHDRRELDLLDAALDEGAGFTERAARILATLGESGYAQLEASVPADGRTRGYAIKGVAAVAHDTANAARRFARAAAHDLHSDALHQLRALDLELYLEGARRRLTAASSERNDGGRAAPV